MSSTTARENRRGAEEHHVVEVDGPRAATLLRTATTLRSHGGVRVDAERVHVACVKGGMFIFERKPGCTTHMHARAARTCTHVQHVHALSFLTRKGVGQVIKQEIGGPAFSLSLTPIHSLRHRLVRSRQSASIVALGFLRF